MTEDSRHWCTVPGLRLRWRRWDEETILYNCNSGDAHLLNDVAARSLEILQNEATTIEGLSAKVSRSLNLKNDERLCHGINDFVIDLARLGIVCPSDDSC
ncbi:MAG TPA: HPr-rel-A system PqqD family peptide chaperone [Geoalkalibacter subterraneus]|uniref:HPr-rel-A system PqqD family peptide chaperone n=1 Tax=Geoalkalibacter subterraneus TaxID=483547 RepID=A0A831LN50_9BACT|nr:HPr-rel-A system PqqD family peptide chaperone [Geoalkalibacter subterraneus]